MQIQVLAEVIYNLCGLKYSLLLYVSIIKKSILLSFFQHIFFSLIMLLQGETIKIIDCTLLRMPKIVLKNK